MKMSLGRKIMVFVVLLSVLIITICIVVSGIVFRRLMDKEYLITGDSMAGTVAVSVDGDRVKKITDKVMAIYRSTDVKISNEAQDEDGYEAYCGLYKHLMDDPDYIAVRDSLRKIQDVSEVDCVYTLFIVPEEKTAVYIVDAAHEDIVPPGCFDYVEESCYPYLDDLEQGFPAFITDTEEYGWVATACMPIHDSSGELVCFSAVDLSMNDILTKVRNFLFSLTALLLVLTAVVCVTAMIYVKRRIVKPINLLSAAAGQYSQKQVHERHNEFGSLNIKTGDEIEILLRSMVQMENDIDTYIDNLTKTREQLSNARQQADDMHELAHMDALTGIRNKLAYDKETARLDREIAGGLSQFGIAMIDLNFLKLINDTYGHECGNSSIKRLSQLVCTTFQHSPVFRIGGDEFVVILRNNDFLNVEKLEQEFNRQFDLYEADPALKPWEKISASLGYALYDAATDDCTDDVFKRADQNMYKRKREMKATRK
ncbi:MAG: diguanylate cyclase [Ruminococcus sp.]|nr:diguanylate cyclase [Ruminococcus sp.]